MPAVVDLAAMRDAMAGLGGDPNKINPLVPVDLVIDHSVMVDVFGSAKAFQKNVELEYERNKERYEFLRWGAGAFNNFRVVPPGTGICHQVNLEYLAQTVWTKKANGGNPRRLPRHLVGTDSHTTMVNGLAVLGWGVGGIEAEAAMLGQPISMLIPEVIGFRLHRQAEGRRHRHRPRADRHPDAAQARRGRQVRRVLRRRPRQSVARGSRHHRQHGAGIRRHLRLLPGRRGDAHLSQGDGARTKRRIALVEAYTKAQGLCREADTPDPVFTKHARARSRDGRAVAGRTEAPAGPRAADQGRRRLRRGARQGIRQGARARQTRAGEGHELRPRPRRRGDRRHHLLHQHVEPFRDDRRRARSPRTR